ncbi:MAG: hypothetical protein ACI4KD_08015 [Oscillospiraceae bacterium]
MSQEFEIEPYYQKTHNGSGNFVLITTDGLTDKISDEDLNSIFRNTNAAESVAEKLFLTANERGISDNIEFFSVDERIKPAVFHLAERSRRRCRCLFDHQHSTSKRHCCQRISDNHLPYRRKAIAAEI